MFAEENLSCFSEWGEEVGVPMSLSYVRMLKYFWISVVVAEGWCGIWYVMWIYGILPASDKYIYALSDFSIVFSLFFYEYLRKAWQNYTSGPDMYYRMLYKVSVLGMYIFSAIEYSDQDNSVTLLDKQQLILDNIRHELDTLLYQISIMFMPHKKNRLKRPMHGETLNQPASVSSCLDSLFHVRIWTTELNACKCIGTGGINSINTYFDQLIKLLEDIETSKNVGVLDSIDWYIILVIGIYFVIIIPYKVVTSVSYIIFLLYPFLIFAMMGTFLIRKYSGSPFSKNNNIESNPLDKWYDHFRQRNNIYHVKLLMRIAKKNGTEFDMKKYNDTFRQIKHRGTYAGHTTDETEAGSDSKRHGVVHMIAHSPFTFNGGFDS